MNNNTPIYGDPYQPSESLIKARMVLLAKVVDGDVLKPKQGNKMDDTTEVPYTLTKEYILKQLKITGGANTLDTLADRGIYLNTWQVNELLMGGGGYGKTYLAFVKIAEAHKDTGFTLNADSDIAQYDQDAHDWASRRTFLRGFRYFLEEYYSDIYTLKTDCSDDITATIIKKPIKRWWNV